MARKPKKRWWHGGKLKYPQIRGDSASHSPEYTAWVDMRKRCQRPSHPQFSGYGGRGIRVCARWNDFWAFFTDVGERPSPKHSIDRIDNNGDYEPGNCRWATKREQSNNQRRNVFVGSMTVAEAERLGLVSAHAVHIANLIRRNESKSAIFLRSGVACVEHEGRSVKLSELCKELDADYGRVYARLRYGWTLEKALSEPQSPANRHVVHVDYKGRSVKLKELCKELGVDFYRAYWRLKKGWTVEAALSLPKLHRSSRAPRR